MEELYLNQADGRKPKKLLNYMVKNPLLLYKRLKIEISKILSISSKEFIGFAQNATTNLIYTLKPILEKNDYKIFLSSHEIRWYKELFKIGKLPVKDTTFPNYTKQVSISFLKRKAVIFDPHEFIQNPEKFLSKTNPSIIILSHVSRMTGEKFATKKLYERIKKIHSNNIFVIDGTQAVGALECKPKTLSDVYIGVTSKFIGAELHIGFCWISKKITKHYKLDEWNINPKKFAREIFSTLESIRDKNKYKGNIKNIRKYLNKKLKEYKIPTLLIKNQVPYIALIPIKEPRLSQIIKKLRQKNIIVSSNIKWSVTEPKISALRVSLIPSLTHNEIEYFVKILSNI